MKTAQFLSHPPRRVPQLVWYPVQKVVLLALQMQQVVEQVTHQVRDLANLVLRTMDGVALQTTRVRTRSHVEWVFGPLTFSVASGVTFSRPAGGVPE